jgi:MFS-type transporter involved in bile tolerance (Atg22 family)
MQRISPPRYLGEFYGLYATVGRFATILGPLMWGVIVTIIGLPREVAMAALLGFIVLSRYVLEGVDDRPRHWRSTDLSR